MKLGSKPMGMHVEPSGALRLALFGALLAVLGSAVVLVAVAAGALVVPAAASALVPVVVGYGLPVLALICALLVRRRPLVGGFAVLGCAGAAPFVYGRSAALALVIPLAVGAVVAVAAALHHTLDKGPAKERAPR